MFLFHAKKQGRQKRKEDAFGVRFYSFVFFAVKKKVQRVQRVGSEVNPCSTGRKPIGTFAYVHIDHIQ